MKINEASWDRILRVILGLAGLGLAFYLHNWWVGAVGAILLVTGAVGLCPLYALFGVSTCKVKHTQS